MAEETKAYDSNTKTQLSLAAALFFSPLVQNMLKRKNLDLSDKDTAFISGYVKFGYITILFGLITISAGVLNYLFVFDILNVVYTASIFILIFLLIISIVSILSDISLIKGEHTPLQGYTIEGSKKDIIIKYLPIHDIRLRYTLHNFDTPNRWIKESLLRRTFFTITAFLGMPSFSITLLIVIILRIASLMSDIDILPIKSKQRLNALFLKNPEEIRGYVTGTFSYLGKSLIHNFVSLSPYSLEAEIKKEKDTYSRIIEIPGNISLIAEYLIGIGIVIGTIWIFNPGLTIRTYYAGCGLLIARYLTMALQLKHLPHLPIAREIIAFFLWIGSLFKKTPFTPHTS